MQFTADYPITDAGSIANVDAELSAWSWNGHRQAILDISCLLRWCSRHTVKNTMWKMPVVVPRIDCREIFITRATANIHRRYRSRRWNDSATVAGDCLRTSMLNMSSWANSLSHILPHQMIVNTDCNAVRYNRFNDASNHPTSWSHKINIIIATKLVIEHSIIR